MGAHSHDAQHPQNTGSEFYMDGLDTDALDPMLQKKVMEAVKPRTKQAESLARVAEVKVKAREQWGGRGARRRESPAPVSLIFDGRLGRPCHRSFAHDVLARKGHLAPAVASCRKSAPERSLSRLCSKGLVLDATRIKCFVNAQTFSKHEAVSARLHGGVGFDTLDLPVGGLALCYPARLSVPDSAVDLVSLANSPRGDARDCVCRWSELMLNSESEQKLVDATSEPPRLYQERKLAGSPFGPQVFHPHTLWEGACALLEDTEVPLHVFLCP